jgi:prepilin-type N-terminal cleavage/methylation domain-containing protein
MTKNKRGFTIIEMIVTLGIVAMVITMGARVFRASFSRWEASSGVRTVTAAMSTARYNAINMNRSVKFCVEKNRIVLKEKIKTTWQPFTFFDVDANVSLSINASPVFSPTGLASPLCTIYVENRHYKYKITLSSAGRIKVLKMIG